MAGLAHLREHGVEWNALTTIHAANQDAGARGLPVPARRVRRPVHAVHPDRRAGDARDAAGRQRGMGRGRARAAPLHAGGEPGHRALDLAGRLRPVPDRRVRGLGAARRRRGVRADVRRGARQLARGAAEPVRAFGDVRARARARAHGRPVLVRPLRGAGVQARQHQGHAHARADRLAAAAEVRAGQARHAAALLPGVRRAVRLSRRLPEGPVHRRSRTASRVSTTCARASRRSSTTSTGRCG